MLAGCRVRARITTSQANRYMTFLRGTSKTRRGQVDLSSLGGVHVSDLNCLMRNISNTYCSLLLVKPLCA